MTIDDKIKDEKVKHNISREAAKISAKYEYVTGEEVLPSDESRIIEQAKFIYSPFRKAFEKQIKTIEDQGIKQVEAFKDLQLEENKKI